MVRTMTKVFAAEIPEGNRLHLSKRRVYDLSLLRDKDPYLEVTVDFCDTEIHVFVGYCMGKRVNAQGWSDCISVEGKNGMLPMGDMEEVRQRLTAIDPQMYDNLVSDINYICKMANYA